MSEAKRVDAQNLVNFAAALFEAKGMIAAHARTLAEVIVWADLRGVSSHGVNRLSMYLRTIRDGDLDPKAVPQIVDKAGALFVVEGNRCPGPVAMKLAMQEAITRAKNLGVGLGVVRATTHTGAIGHYAHLAAEQGMVALVFNSGPPNMAYHGAKVKSLATSPLAIGVPASNGPLLLDMATSTIANGRLQQAIRLGQQIPEGCALTKEGVPTTDPSQADILLPLGGPKGSGISFMFEAITGVLAANPLLASMIGPGGKVQHRHNAMVIVINVAALRPLDEFKRDMDELGRVVKALPRLDPEVEISLPGERSAKQFAERSTKGIPLPPKIWANMLELAEQNGVAPPVTR